LEGIPSERLATNISDINLEGGDIPVQKSLGVIWDPRQDHLQVKVSKSEYAWTRRGFLSFESKFFDPLGLIDPYKLPAKLILRDLAVMGFDWDDRNIPPEIKGRWEAWVKHLDNLNGVSLPRCHMNLHNAKLIELHGFADASKVGYDIVYYLRIYDGVKFNISFVLGKAKVLPSICTTTPRAELHAAMELVEFSRSVVREHQLEFHKIVFWSDSQTVLGYLKNPNKRLPIFEANRVKKILSSSSAKQWRWIDTAQNPADYYSRGVSPIKLSTKDAWLQGPSFLLNEEEHWPTLSEKLIFCSAESNDLPIEGNANAISVASEALCVEGDNAQSFENTPQSPFMNRLLCHYSTLSRLLRAVSLWRRVILMLRNRVYRRLSYCEVVVAQGPISASEYTQSLSVVIHLAQGQAFPGALEALELGNCHDIDAGKHGALVKKVLTPIRKYCPFLHDGVMRIGGRLQKSDFSFDRKHPIVLPKRHPVTCLIVLDAHVQCGHFGANYVLNELLSKYHVVGGKATVKQCVKKLCIECRNRNARPCTQQMAPLPTGRVAVRHCPFEHCGMDYLCGLKVKQGRSELKRYGCIFTCLSTRSTHLEVVHDLSTEAFLMAFRRFLALTGSATKVLYSDNGTNFRGAEIEMKRGLERLDKHRIVGDMAKRGVEFRFNPPRASHQGGIFESIIKLVRKTLVALMDDKKLRTLTDDGLETLFREVQMILNKRPLTKTTNDPEDTRALSPQSILTGSLDPIYPPDVFLRSDGLRSSFRLTQAYAEEFWKRFITEYVPMLNKREKWLAPQRNLQVGDLVLLYEEPGVRYRFAKALITAVQPDKFGQVRRVTVRSPDGNLHDREVAKICLLEADAEVESADAHSG